ncbi:hypothetical protein Lal_00038283 [Lupinus albus]|uniref:Uncharacterized protein n=1 Tax=Lupinus albus TaxID=3870 RepID=A0A6A5NFT2_LUPAL|nr:hypothetical protein Lalb_Chr19g0125031 [Lupinus albus]KAF1883929.1 hypothetical protein Lal_00038283 [Lupinus albus]
MAMNKPHVLLMLIIMVVSISEKPLVIEGRTLSLISNQGYSKIFATLGVVCKCCDGDEGACTNTWTKSCNNLKCLPWKSH